jgi:methionyl aminopeptidase
MLSEKELNVMRDNGRVHKKVFEKIREIAFVGTSAKDIDDLALKMCKDAGVLSAFTGVYGYTYTLQTSVNDVVVHGRPLASIIFQEGDVVTFDFGVKDKKYGICTDAAFTMIIGDENKYPQYKEFLEVGKEALKRGIAQAKHGNRI